MRHRERQPRPRGPARTLSQWVCRWFDGITNHTVLRYVNWGVHDTVGEE